MAVKHLTFGLALLAGGTLQAQLTVTNTLTPQQLVQDVLLGTGVTVSNVSYNGVLNPAAAQVGSGSFTDRKSVV